MLEIFQPAETEAGIGHVINDGERFKQSIIVSKMGYLDSPLGGRWIEPHKVIVFLRELLGADNRADQNGLMLIGDLVNTRSDFTCHWPNYTDDIFFDQLREGLLSLRLVVAVITYNQLDQTAIDASLLISLGNSKQGAVACRGA